MQTDGTHTLNRRDFVVHLRICCLSFWWFTGFYLFAEQNHKVDSLINQFSIESSDSSKINVLIELSSVLSGVDPEKSRDYAESALTDYENPTVSQLTRIHRYLGFYFWDGNTLDSAIQQFEKASQFALQLENSFESLRIATHLVDLHRQMGQYEQAFNIAFEALSLAEDQNQIPQAASISNRIGDMYRDQYQTDNAIIYLNKAYQYYEEAGRERGMLSARVNLALTYKQRNARKALDTYHGVLRDFHHLFNTWDSARLYSNLANIHMDLNEFAEAENFLRHALSCHQRIDKTISRAYCYKELAELYLRTDKPQKVIKNAHRAYSIAQRLQHNTLRYQSSKQLSDAYARLNLMDSAYLYLQISVGFQDSVLKRERIEISEALEAKYSNSQKEQQILFQEEQLSRQSAEISQEITIRNSLFAGIILVLIIGSMIHRNAKLQTKRAAEVEQHSIRIQELQSVQSRWFTNIAHELRTPLTLILGPLQNLLQKPSLPVELKKDALLAKKYGLQLTEHVNEILEVSKLESGKLVLQEEPVDMVRLIKQALSSFESLASQKEIDLSLEEPSFNPILRVDRKKILTILNNLVSNSLKFTQAQGSIRLFLIQTEQFYEIQVKDSGYGIDKLDLPNLFDRFYQSGKHQASHGGLGIGLTLSQELAKLHGGIIVVDSELNKGSTFSLKLPDSLQTESTPEDLESTEVTKIDDQAPSNTRTAKPIILIVEDHPDMRMYMRSFLLGHYQLLEAREGNEALRLLEKTRPDLIISDVKMPGMDGLTFANVIKNQSKFRLTPFITLTAHANEKDKLISFKAGVDDYLLKPFDTEELLIRIDNLITNHRERQKAVEEVDRETHRGESMTLDEQLIQELENRVNEHLSNASFSVPDLAKISAMSISTLTRLIKKMTGLTPGQFIRELRLLKAIELLESNRFATISEVVYSIGFEDVSSFSRLFKKRFGKSPSTFVKSQV